MNIFSKKTYTKKTLKKLFGRVTVALSFLLPFFLILFSSFPVLATFSHTLTYQGKLTDSGGSNVANGNYTMRFRLYDAPTAGTLLFDETTTTVAVASGIFTTYIGEASSTVSINWNQPLYLGVTINTDAEMTPRKKLSSSPSAFEADKLDGYDSTDLLTQSFSTSSADYWKTGNNFFSTTSANAWSLLGYGFSTTSSDFWKTANNFFSTTSADYFLSNNQGSSFSSTSADYWITASTTIPKTNIANTWAALNIFTYASTTALTVIGNSYLGTTSITNLAVTDTSTSTFAGGVNITSGTTGCFAVNNVCITGGGSSSQWTTNLSDIYHNIGNVGIGTSSPYAPLSVVGQIVGSYFTATSTNATSTFRNLEIVGNASTSNLVASNVFNLNGAFYQGGLINCNGVNDKVIYNFTTGKFSCGSDQSSSGSSSGVANMSISSSSSVFNVAVINTLYQVASTTITPSIASNDVWIIASIVPKVNIPSAGGTSNFAMSVRRGSSCTSGIQIGATTTIADNSKANPSTDSVTLNIVDSPQSSAATTYLVCLTTDNIGTGASVDNWSMTAQEVKIGGGIAVEGNWSTTSANYWSSLGLGFSSTSADYWITASTTIPKTTIANTWAALNIFTYASTTALTVIGNSYLATTTIGTGVSSGETLDVIGSFGVENVAGTNVFVVGTNGNVGIGTSSPNQKLVVEGGVCVTAGTTCPAEVSGMIVADGLITASAFDLAENYSVKDSTIEKGDIISIDSSFDATVKKASNNEVVIGIVSTKPGLTLGAKDENTRPIALSGRVPTKVNLENGPIAIGDRIAISSTAGVGMKMSSTSDQSVGIALESYNNEPEKNGKILVFVNLSWNKLDVLIANGTLGGSTSKSEIWTADSNGAIKMVSAGILDMQGQDIVNVRKLLSSSGKWSISEEGVLVVEEVRAKDIKASNTLCAGSVCIDEAGLRDLLFKAGVSSVGQTQNTTPQTAPTTTPNLETESPSDTKAPVITLIGDNPANLTVTIPATVYSDNGAEVSDITADGTINNNLGFTTSVWKDGTKLYDDVSSQTLNTTASITYEIRYNATDNANNNAVEVVRTVNVTAPAPIVPPLDLSQASTTSDTATSTP